MEIVWRGGLTNPEINELHAEAFETRVFDESEWNWVEQLPRRSLGWVTARIDGDLVGFANLISDGTVHAWIQDVMVAKSARRLGVGVGVVLAARDGATRAGCEWLHVDFDDHLRPFYLDACGFAPTNAGLIRLG